MTKLNALVLHRMGDPNYWLEAVRSLEYMIQECRPDVNCIVHNSVLPFPEYLKEVEYHLIVLGPTFLCSRYHEHIFNSTLKKYSFIAESKGCKVALPQDDYDCSGILDEWMVDWSIDRIYTVCPEHWSLLYPKSINNIDIRLGYTGYISESWIDSWKNPKPHDVRKIDVSYRASKLPANFGRIGQFKWQIANMFRAAVSNYANLRLDISVDQEDRIPGKKWHSFLEDSKFCLATASGSSLLDPWNEIRSCTNRYIANNPTATFEEIEHHCFKNLDGLAKFTAISPRNIEAALAETVQIATPGSYSGLMDPIDHYIPLADDCSNISEVMDMINDPVLVSSIKKRCKDSILSEPRLRRTAIVNEIIEFAQSVTDIRNLKVNNQEKIDVIFKKHSSEMENISRRFWKRKRIEQKLRAIALKLGLQRLKFLFP